MHKLVFRVASLFFLVISASSFAAPIRHHFNGQIEGSSFGYEGHTVTGWYEYDFDNYDPNEPALHNFFSYFLKVGDLEITEGFSPEVIATVNYSSGAVHSLSLTGETPVDHVSGNGFNMDVIELFFNDGSSPGIPENYSPTPETFNLNNLIAGGFEIYGHSEAILPDHSYGVFWLKGSLEQLGASHYVPEPSLLTLFVSGLFMCVWRRRTKKSA